MSNNQTVDLNVIENLEDHYAKIVQEVKEAYKNSIEQIAPMDFLKILNKYLDCSTQEIDLIYRNHAMNNVMLPPEILSLEEALHYLEEAQDLISNFLLMKHSFETKELPVFIDRNVIDC